MNRKFTLSAIFAALGAAILGMGSCSGPQNTLLSVAPSDSSIMYMGRIDRSNPDAYAFNYPGVTAMFNFEGDTLRMAAKPGSGYFMVEIDTIAPFKVHFGEQDSLIALAEGLSEGPHSARITYAIEGYEFMPEFRGFEITNGRMLPAPERPELKIEFIGNSITCGYGNEDSIASNGFAYETENHTITYAHLTARRLNADVNVVARSGIGIYRNYGTPTEGSDDTMPLEYDQTMLYQDEPKWDFAQFQPDIVFVNLGTNDTSENKGDMKLFEETYAKFLDHLLDVYPQAQIVLATGSMMEGERLEKVKSALDNLANDKERVHRFDFSPQTGELGYGASWHPSTRQHQRMADELTPYLQSLINK